MATTQRLILGSASPARRELLAQAGYDFEVLASGVDEPAFQGFSGPRAFVQHVSWLKAEALAARVHDGLILTADSIAWLNEQVIGKPVDRPDARRILRQLGGSQHELWTGVCLWQRPGEIQVCWQERSLVFMRRFSDTELEAYLDTGIWEGKSGAYAIQANDDPYVQVIEGSMSNVVGLPLESLAEVLAAHGFQ